MSTLPLHDTPAPAAAALPTVLPNALLSAFGRGAAVAAVLTALAWMLGLHPAGTGGLLALGAGAALLAGGAAIVVHGRLLDRRADVGGPRVVALRLQALLAFAFGIKLAVLLVAVFALRAAEVKFAGLATFGVAFATASLVCQLTTAGYLGRVVQRRSSPGGTKHT